MLFAKWLFQGMRDVAEEVGWHQELVSHGSLAEPHLREPTELVSRFVDPEAISF